MPLDGLVLGVVEMQGELSGREFISFDSLLLGSSPNFRKFLAATVVFTRESNLQRVVLVCNVFDESNIDSILFICEVNT